MVITHLGMSCIKMAIKTVSGKEYTLVTDPFDAKKSGVKLSKQKADIVVVSEPESESHNNVESVVPADESVFTIKEPGEYEVREIFVHGVSAEPGKHAYVIEAERIKMGFLGGVATSPVSDAVASALENIDILCLPVGGGSVLTAKNAAQVVRQLEPRMVIPLYYKVAGAKEKLSTVQDFVKEVGTKSVDELDKLKITKKEMPQEDMRITILKV